MFFLHFRHGLRLLLLWGGLPWAANAQPLSALNDSGQTQCVDAALMPGPCAAATAGDAADGPGQDGRHGRDALPGLGKVGGGEAGFDLTRLCWNGAEEGGALCTGPLVANTGASPSATPTTDWACTRDNVTGRVWSLQSISGVSWSMAVDAAADAGHNAGNRCGFADWRLPTVHELRSIVHHGRRLPAIDPAYFPDTQTTHYWSANTHVESATMAWAVNFGGGGSGFLSKGGFAPRARLVRHAF